jgi:plastocyanin
MVVVTTAFVLLPVVPATAGGGGHQCIETFSDEATTEVGLDGTCFTPTVIRIRPGDTVTWTNNEGVPHTVSGAGDLWGGYRDMGLGDSVSYRFDESGTFPYFCVYHPGMVGAVVVGDGKAATSSSGTVVPMGEDQMPLGSAREAPVVEDSRSPLLGIGLGVLLLAGTLVAIGRRRIRSGLPRSQAG